MDRNCPDDKEEKLPTNSKVILGVSLALTTGALVAAVFLARTLCATFPACLELNAWGDFVAGMFAPIAIVWLVAAVLLQTIELREQRKELALTRREFQENRTVMEAQVQEAKNQGALMAAQTDLLARAAADSEFMTMLSHFRLWYEGALKRAIPGVPHAKHYPSDYIFIRLVSVLNTRADVLANFRFYNEFEPFIDGLGVEGLNELCNILANMSPLRDRVSSSARVIFDNSDVVPFVSRFVNGEDDGITLEYLLRGYEAWKKSRSPN